MKIFVLGGDGFCGWPTSLHLSSLGHEVIIIDNLVRRKIDIELQVDSLTPIATIEKRINRWKEISNNEIGFYMVDIAKEYDVFLDIINKENPDVIIHFAEQRAAPYSMKSSKHKRYTVDNNLNATNNILAAIVESEKDIHLVHLGTMGVYGYSTVGAAIPEGYLDVWIENLEGKKVKQEVLYPTSPGSIYHLTKSQDQILFAFYNKNDNVRITDLHQGIVWGTETKETKLHEELINRFDYDGDYGTVLNRFLMQAAVEYPLTVHGTGGQTRAFIHIQDTVKCIEIAVNNPPKNNDKVKILNQMTETHRVRELANIIKKITNIEINYLKNPRHEAEENDLIVKNDNFLEYGLNPIKLEDGLLHEINKIAKKYAHRCDKSKILCVSYWNKNRK